MHTIKNTTMYMHDICSDPNWEAAIFSLPQSPSTELGEESQEKEGLNLFKVILSMPPLFLLSCMQLSILSFWKSMGNILAFSSFIVIMCSLPMKIWHSEKQQTPRFSTLLDCTITVCDFILSLGLFSGHKLTSSFFPPLPVLLFLIMEDFLPYFSHSVALAVLQLTMQTRLASNF